MMKPEMKHVSIFESFERPGLHSGLEWLNPPARWYIDPAGSRLLVNPDPQTDFWQRTHYGFRADNGHLLGIEISGDGVMEVSVSVLPLHQYDQAGLIVRANEDCWLKTSVEYEPSGPSQLGVVVTNYGFSDWSLQDFARGQTLSYRLRVRWERDDFFVEHGDPKGAHWRLMRVAHLFREPGALLRCGLYACSPKENGFQAQFQSFRIETE